MRFINKSSSRVSYLLKKKEFQKTLLTKLGLKFTDVGEILDMNKNIFNLPRHRLMKNCLICQKYNVNPYPVLKFHYCLKLVDYKLEHRINVLKDIGAPDINSSLICKMVCLFRKQIPEFKNKTNISVEHNITKNIFDRLDHEAPSNISQLESSNDLTIGQYYKACLLYCKRQVFDLPYLDDKILLNKYMKFKSISMIAETLKVLRINLDYNKELIKRNPLVITASADNIKSLLDSFTDICGISMTTLLRRFPHMLFQDADNIKQLLISFKRYEIPDEYVIKCMKIFEVGNDIFLKRMEIIKRHSDLHVWCKHPRILQIIVHRNMVKDRINYFDFLNHLKWVYPQMILSKSADIEKFLQHGTILTKQHLKHIFKEELGTDKSDLLTRHPHWKTIGFADIEQMIQYLKKDFTINEIYQNIHIVLYKQSKVKEVLADLKQRYSKKSEYSFTNGQYLALCLYMLEKDTHFTGDGIWINGHNAKQQSLPRLETRNIAENIDNVIQSIGYSNIEDSHDINVNNFNIR